MSLKKSILGALGALALTAAAQGSALAAPPGTGGAASPAGAQADRARSPHASLELEIGHGKAWVGQALPVTLRAYFRDVEGVTLEGAPQIVSKEIITSELPREPRQSRTSLGGEPALVVTWTGTVTPSSAGPLELSAELPVQLRYREAAPRVAAQDMWQDDPFSAFGADPFDSSVFDRMRQMMERQMMAQPLGRLHEQTVTLKATVPPLEALALPLEGQPASFSGAVGRFDLASSVSSMHLRASEPVTLRVVVSGQGDLDRVDLPGVATSDAWKAYPPKATDAPSKPGETRRQRVFEQVLVPLRGGDLTVPSVSLAAFDPTSGRYVTRETRPLPVSVDGAATPDAIPATFAAAPPDAAASLAPPAAGDTEEAARIAEAPVHARAVALRVAPVLFLVLAAALLGVVRSARRERSLRRTMRRSASEGTGAGFFAAAHALIEARLAHRWGVPPDAVTAPAIRERLGAEGAPLADVLVADEGVRFGRGGYGREELVALCASVEQSLRGVS